LLALLGAQYIYDISRLRVKTNSVRRWFVFNWCREDFSGLCSEEFYGLYSLPNVIRVINSRKMRWAGIVAGMGDRSVAYGVSVGKPE
jgi:hypothetical protein